MKQPSFFNYLSWGGIMASWWMLFGMATIPLFFIVEQDSFWNVLNVAKGGYPFVTRIYQTWIGCGFITGIVALFTLYGVSNQMPAAEAGSRHAGCMSLWTIMVGGMMTAWYYSSLVLPPTVHLKAWYWTIPAGAFGLWFATNFALSFLYHQEGIHPAARPTGYPCPECGGTGKVIEGSYYMLERTCPRCQGAGLLMLDPPFAPEHPDSAPNTNIQYYLREQENYKGIQHAMAGRYQEAEPIFRRLIEEYPDWASPKINLANILIEAKRYNKAEQLLLDAQDCCEDRNERINVLFAMGNVYYHKRSFTLALHYFEQAHELTGDEYDILINLGMCRFYLGEIQTAERLFEQAGNFKTTEKLRHLLKDLNQHDYLEPAVVQIMEAIRAKGFTPVEHPGGKIPRTFQAQLSKLEAFIANSDRPVAFFVGAGISLNAPSNIPLVSRFLEEIFTLLYELDKAEIKPILEKEFQLSAWNAKTVMEAISQRLFQSFQFPFEPTFHRLQSIVGAPVISFVKTLKHGQPNGHHYMLSTALARKHLVVTTNFDNKIETAFETQYPKDRLQTVVSDLEFQHMLDHWPEHGVLAKIHGTMDYYGSLALTSQGIWSTSEFTMNIGDDISREKAQEQQERSHMNSSLSIPKDLAFTQVLDNYLVVFIGYSGSDLYDLMPIIFSEYAKREIAWVSYGPELDKLPKPLREWHNDPSRGGKLCLIRPGNEADAQADIAHAVSEFFSKRLFGQQAPYPVQNPASGVMPYDAFCDWLSTIGFRKGDGLAFLAEFFENNGVFDLAYKCYQGAQEKYLTAQPRVKNEKRIITTKHRIPFCLAYMGEDLKADKLQRDFIVYLEDNTLADDYPDIYANVLLEIAGRYIRDGQILQGKNYLQKAERISEKHNLLQGHIYAEGVKGDLLIESKNYKEALECYLHAAYGCSVIGSAYGEAKSQLGAADCLIRFGEKFRAYQMVESARAAAQKSGDLVLRDQVEAKAFSVWAYFELNHKVDRSRERLEKTFKHLLAGVQTGMQRFLYLLFHQDRAALDHIFNALNQKAGYTEDQVLAIKWYEIVVDIQFRDIDLAKQKIAVLPMTTEDQPYFDFEWLKLEYGLDAVPENAEMQLDNPFFKAMVERGVMETRPAMVLAKNKIEYALREACRDFQQDYWELMSWFNQLQVQKAFAALERLKKMIDPSKKDQLAAIIWHESLLCKRERKTEQEKALLEQLLRDDPDNLLFNCNLGVACLSLNQLDQAEKYLTHAFERANKNYPLVLSHLGVVYARKGQKQKAKGVLDLLKAIGGSQNSINYLEANL